MTLEQAGSVACMVYFMGMAYVGIMFAFDFVKTYPFPEPRQRTIGIILLVAAVLFLGFFPFVLIGTYAMALITTGWLEKRKR